MIIACVFILFVFSVAGCAVALRLFFIYKKAYLIERHLHTSTLVECRAMYEEVNRHLRRSGLGEMPTPELLEQETIKRLNDETNLHLFNYGITTNKLRRR